MEHDYKITNLKTEEVVKSFRIIEEITGVDVKDLIIDAAKNGQYEDHINCLDTLGYLAMKSLLVVHKIKETLENRARQDATLQ